MTNRRRLRISGAVVAVGVASAPFAAWTYTRGVEDWQYQLAGLADPFLGRPAPGLGIIVNLVVTGIIAVTAFVITRATASRPADASGAPVATQGMRLPSHLWWWPVLAVWGGYVAGSAVVVAGGGPVAYPTVIRVAFGAPVDATVELPATCRTAVGRPSLVAQLLPTVDGFLGLELRSVATGARYRLEGSVPAIAVWRTDARATKFQPPNVPDRPAPFIQATMADGSTRSDPPISFLQAYDFRVTALSESGMTGIAELTGTRFPDPFGGGQLRWVNLVIPNDPWPQTHRLSISWDCGVASADDLSARLPTGGLVTPLPVPVPTPAASPHSSPRESSNRSVAPSAAATAGPTSRPTATPTPTPAVSARRSASPSTSVPVPATCPQRPVADSGQAFSTVDLGTLGGAHSSARDINDRGQVVGWADTGRSYYAHAFVWSEGTMSDLGTLADGGSWAMAINDRGQVAGYSGSPTSGFEAVLWENGRIRDLGTLGGPNAIVTDINERGHVVGWSNTASGDRHGFLWKDGVMTDLGTLGGSESLAFGISESDDIVGQSSTGEPGAVAVPHAFLWQDGVMVDIGMSDWWGGAAAAINSHGDTAGRIEERSGASRAYLSRDGSIVELGAITGATRLVAALNDSDEVVGWDQFGMTGVDRAFLWRDGGAIQLGSRPWSEAYAINDCGQVVGTSGDAEQDNHATLWTR